MDFAADRNDTVVAPTASSSPWKQRPSDITPQSEPRAPIQAAEAGEDIIIGFGVVLAVCLTAAFVYFLRRLFRRGLAAAVTGSEAHSAVTRVAPEPDCNVQAQYPYGQQQSTTESFKTPRSDSHVLNEAAAPV